MAKNPRIEFNKSEQRKLEKQVAAPAIKAAFEEAEAAAGKKKRPKSRADAYLKVLRRKGIKLNGSQTKKVKSSFEDLGE